MPNDHEMQILNHLAKAWNGVVALPVMHDEDVDEFRTLIHAMQDKILARPGRRALSAVQGAAFFDAVEG